MADCFPPESDDLHRRWLPREIFADIGIVDPDSAAAAAEPTPEAAAAAAVEELAAQLAGILGGGGANKVWPLSPPSPPATPPVAASVTAAAPCHGAKVCGLEGSSVVMSCGGTNGGAGAGVSWPFVPYPQFQWQVGNSNLVNHGGVLDCYPVLPPALPCHVPPPPANLRGGTGVFLPRVEAYRHAPASSPSPPATAKGGAWAPAAAAKPSSWAGTGGRPVPAKKPSQAEHATPTKQQQHQKQQAATGAALALPQDWSYR